MFQFIDLSAYGILLVRGQGASLLLQGQFTCHVPELNAKIHSFAAQCNPEGRVISFFRLFYFLEQYYLLLPRNIMPIALTALKKYAVFYKKVEILDVSNEVFYIGYLIDRCNKFSDQFTLKINTVIDHSQKLLVLLSETPVRYFMLLLEKTRSVDAISRLIEDGLANRAFLSSDYWHQIDVMNGIPSIYPVTSEKFLPHELDLFRLDAVSLNKGCYTGQEIIARMHYRGQTKKQLYRVYSSEPLPQSGTDLYYDYNMQRSIAGTMVDHVSSLQEVGYIGLMILNQAAVENLQLFSDLHAQQALPLRLM